VRYSLIPWFSYAEAFLTGIIFTGPLSSILALRLFWGTYCSFEYRRYGHAGLVRYGVVYVASISLLILGQPPFIPSYRQHLPVSTP